MKTRTLPLLALIGLIALYATPAYASPPTYFGPSFEVTATSQGGPAYLTISTASSSSFVAPPTSSGPVCPSGYVCTFPLQACTDSTQFFYSIHGISVTDPDGNQFTLGSSAAAGMYWPSILGGPAPSIATIPLSDGVGVQGDALNVTLGDTFVVPFGTGAGGFSFVTSLGSPPQTHSPEGPYYWWTSPGSAYGSNLRLDQNPSINPTSIAGTYSVSVEGVAVCGSGLAFDQVLQFSFGTPVPVPQFSAPMVAAVAIGFLVLALARRNSRVVSPA